VTGGAISREYKDRAVGARDGECGEREGGDREGEREGAGERAAYLSLQ
jgi:hypothetical protein